MSHEQRLQISEKAIQTVRKMTDYLVYKTLYYDKETKNAILKEEEFEIEKVGNKWFYLKEFDSNNDIPCQLYINSNYI